MLFSLAYIDDTICFSSSFEGHLADLEVVFDRFRQANLKWKATKCKLFQTRCKFVGHCVSEDGIEVDPAKVAFVVNWPFPTTITELRGFLVSVPTIARSARVLLVLQNL